MKRQSNSYIKRARGMIQSNLRKHAVVFTVSLGRAYFVNRVNPKARTCVNEYTQAVFDPDTTLYSKFRFNWQYYPVVALKDQFGNFDKLYIHDGGTELINATWKEVVDAALIDANEALGEIDPRWRLNCGIVFAIDRAPMTVEKIEQILSMDKDFMVWDEDREIRTNKEIRADELELAAKLEAIA